MTIFSLARPGEASRLGIAATRKLGGAVERNRAKRLIRELFRRHPAPPGFDIVVVPRRALFDATFSSLEAEYVATVGRLRPAPGRRAPGVAARVALTVLRGYKLLLSPVFTGACRFHPSCSSYMAEAIRLHGVIRGGWLGLVRLSRCHPFGSSGFDPGPRAPRLIPLHGKARSHCRPAVVPRPLRIHSALSASEAARRSKPGAADIATPAARRSRRRPVGAGRQPSLRPPLGPPAAATVAETAERSIVVETDVVRAVFSNRGGVITSWTLKKYPGADGKPVDLVPAALPANQPRPFYAAARRRQAHGAREQRAVPHERHG